MGRPTAVWINLNKKSSLFHVAVDYLVPSLTALMNEPERRDGDLARRNVSACQVKLPSSPAQQHIHSSALEGVCCGIFYRLWDGAASRKWKCDVLPLMPKYVECDGEIPSGGNHLRLEHPWWLGAAHVTPVTAPHTTHMQPGVCLQGALT